MSGSADATVPISPGTVELPYELSVPEAASRLVVFSHPFRGLGSSSDPRIAEGLQERGLATLRFDMLTEAEFRLQENTTDWQLLASRLAAVTRWARGREPTRGLDIGYFGTSGGAAPLLVAAATLDCVDGAVTRGGSVDLVPSALAEISDLLLIVGTDDEPFLSINRRANERLGDRSEIHLVDGAGHTGFSDEQFETIIERTAAWFHDL